jgi:ornithine cyclodeaminase
VRPIRAARVFGRNREKREAFCGSMSARLGIPVTAAETPELVPYEADIILTVTNAQTPVLSGDWITCPCLVIGAGANEWYEREIDEKLIIRAHMIVVDEKDDAKREAGDLLWPVGHGLLRWDQVQELGDIVAGRVRAPDFSSSIILFESQGIALEDVVIANEAYELARKLGKGREIQL